MAYPLIVIRRIFYITLWLDADQSLCETSWLVRALAFSLELLLKIFALCLGIFSEAKILFHAVLFLIIVDQVTGVVKAIVKKQFSWDVFKRVYIKIIVYMLVMMATFIFEKYIISTGSIFFTKGIAAIIGFQELASSYINASQALGVDLLKSIIQKFKN